jgi:hypothetical protein
MVAGSLLCVAGILVTMCGTRLDYWRFLIRSQEYHGRVAQACEKLRAEHEKDMPFRIPASKLDSLPTVLRNLDPEYVVVSTNCVSLLIGGGFDAYHIFWVSEEPGGALWQLKACHENGPIRIVLSLTNATQSENPDSPPPALH